MWGYRIRLLCRRGGVYQQRSFSSFTIIISLFYADMAKEWHVPTPMDEGGGDSLQVPSMLRMSCAMGAVETKWNINTGSL